MRNSRVALAVGFSAWCAWGLVACSDDDKVDGFPQGGAGGAAAGSPGAGTAGSKTGGAGGELEAGAPGAGHAGAAEVSGAGGEVAVAGAGGTSGSGGAPGAGAGGSAAGSGGMAGAAITPLILVVDTYLVRQKGSGAGGAGGAGGGGGVGGAAAGAGGASAGAGGATAGAGGVSAGAGGAAAGTGGTAGTAGDAGGIGGTAGVAGLGGVGGTAGTSGSAGAGGVLVVPGMARSYTFDTALTPWVLNPYGSTPGIGQQGGPEKLSALSTFMLNTTEGSPTVGSAQITAPFHVGSEQLDMNQPVSPEENWTGFEVVAKIKVLQAGTIPSACMGVWLYATSDNYFFGRGPEVFIKPGDWVDLRFDLDNPAALGEDRGTQAGFNKAMINQVGMQLETWRCPVP